MSVCSPLRRGGGTPSQVWGFGGYPIPGLARGGTPSQVWPGASTPSQVWWRGGYPISGPGGTWGTPPTRSGWGTTPDLGWGTPLPDLGWGTPADLGPGPPLPPDQHSEHLIRGGRYASCVHAGGLSCYRMLLHLSTFVANMKLGVGGLEKLLVTLRKSLRIPGVKF